MNFRRSGKKIFWLLVAMLGLSLPPVLARDVVLLGVFPDRVLVEIDGQRTVLMMGQDAQQGVRLLSANTLERRAWLDIDGLRREMALVPRSPPAAFEAAPAELRIHPDASGELTVSGSVRGHAVRFRIDTAMALTLLSGDDARRFGIAAEQGPLTTVQTPTGRVFGHRVTLARVQVGGIALNEVEAVVLPGDSPRLPVLGRSFLDRLHLRQDGQVLVLREARR